MTQYYVIELQKYIDGSYGDIKHVTWDEDPTKARLKAESKFYEVLSAFTKFYLRRLLVNCLYMQRLCLHLRVYRS